MAERLESVLLDCVLLLWRNSKRKNASKEKKQPNAKRFVNGIGNLFFYVYWLWF